MFEIEHRITKEKKGINRDLPIKSMTTKLDDIRDEGLNNLEMNVHKSSNKIHKKKKKKLKWSRGSSLGRLFSLWFYF